MAKMRSANHMATKLRFERTTTASEMGVNVIVGIG